METTTAQALKVLLRREFGQKPCQHPKIEEEYEMGVGTGRWFCLACGKDLEAPSWEKKLLSRSS